LIKSKDKIEANVKDSKKALDKHKSHVEELRKMIKDQAEGAAKKELENVADNA